MFFQQFQSSISNPSLGNFSQYPLHPAAGASVPLNTNIQSFHGVTPTPIFEPSQLSVNTPVKTQCPANHHRFQCHSSLNTTGDNLVLCSDQQLGIPTPLHTNFQIPPHLQQGVFMPGYNNQAHYGHGYPQHPVAGPSSAQNFVPRNGAGAHANFQNRGSYQQQRRHR